MRFFKLITFCLLMPCLGFAADVTTNVNVVDTIVLNLGFSNVPFDPITYATLSTSNSKTFSTVQAYTTNSVNTTLLMTSNLPADSSNNPQVKDGSTPANYISYTVSFRPCYRPASQPIPSTYLLKIGVPQLIPTPYSLSSACFVPGGATLGVMTFTRLPLTTLPIAGGYTGTLTFTLSET